MTTSPISVVESIARVMEQNAQGHDRNAQAISDEARQLVIAAQVEADAHMAAARNKAAEVERGADLERAQAAAWRATVDREMGLEFPTYVPDHFRANTSANTGYPTQPATPLDAAYR